MLIVLMLSVCYAECSYAECHGTIYETAKIHYELVSLNLPLNIFQESPTRCRQKRWSSFLTENDQGPML
jgi:hypothetical protein